MSFDIVRKIIDQASLKKGVSDILFFGGEPLLQKDLIYQTVEYCHFVEEKANCRFSFSINTNGLLLDEDFLRFSVKNNILAGISIDGIRQAHDRNRVDFSGYGTYSIVAEKAEMLLEAQPYALALTVINPETSEFLADSIEHLIEMGFRYLLCGLNYKASWNIDSMRLLEKQYRKISKTYFTKLEKGLNIYFSPFDEAISTYINKRNLCKETCELGMRQLAIDTNGNIYPCIQFIGDEKFILGNSDIGIDTDKHRSIFEKSRYESDVCTKCSIIDRCNHSCSCIRKLSTGRIDRISPVLCSYERTLIPIADSLAKKLYKKKVSMFVEKFYNDLYPLILDRK